MVSIPLKEMPDLNWGIKFDKILQDDFIKRKYSRDRRLKEKDAYIDKWMPEIKNGNHLVFDIGPGPGEFLELCRYYGNGIRGIDSAIKESMMGDNYLSLCLLLYQRQQLPVLCSDFMNIIRGNNDLDYYGYSVINSQGSIEQVFRQHIEFEEEINSEGWIPSHNGYWADTKKCRNDFLSMFILFDKMLVIGGKVVLFPNGSKNNNVFYDLINNSLDKVESLKIEGMTDSSNRLRVIRKVGSTTHS